MKAGQINTFFQRLNREREQLSTNITAAFIFTVAAAVAAAAAMAVGVATPLSVSTSGVAENQNVDIVYLFRGPINDLPIPVEGPNLSDTCTDSSARYIDGNCYPLLRQGPCQDPRQWYTLDPFTFQV